MNSKINTYQNIFFDVNVSPFTKVYGAARTLLALGTLLTLLLNNNNIIFSAEKISSAYDHNINVIDLFVLAGYHHLVIAKLIAIVILLAVISGVYPRVTGILHWWVSFSVFHGLIVLDGGDQVTQVLTFFLIFITILDKRKNHWYGEVQQSALSMYAGNVFLLIIRLQVSIIYLVAAISKLYVHEWVNGTAMYYWLTGNSFAAPDYLMWLVRPIVSNHIGTCLLTWGSITFEFLLVIGFLFNATIRKRLFRAAILFHLLIFIFMGVVSLFFAMAGALVLYLYPVNKQMKLSSLPFQTV